MKKIVVRMAKPGFCISVQHDFEIFVTLYNKLNLFLSYGK